MFILRVKYSKQSNFPSFNILKNGCTMIMKRVNSKDRLQIYKNNKLIANIFVNDENLFAFDTITSNNTISKNYVFSINTNLWHARLGHFYNNDIKDFVI